MITELTPNREGYLESNTERQCTNCLKIFTKTNNSMSICNKCNTIRVKCCSAEYKMHNRAKERAKKDSIPFNLEVSDIIIPQSCPIFNMPLVRHEGTSGGKIYSPSLDRIIPELGYVKGNVRVISHLANMMKSNATNDQLITFANWILTNHKNTEEI